MSLTSGTTLGPYEIIARIGAGGMGEVYRARDPRVGRDVALKVSGARFSERFHLEAQAVAALNHSNICTLFDVGPDYLVMELVEGDSPKGPLPLAEALRITGQIAAALESAHERGITHRDLKPANIKVKPDGTVKVLDFGLARMENPPDVSGDVAPTIGPSATETGIILGSPGYMAPEQVSGKLVDKRSDIWAFGVILYELITGRRLFRGDSLAETLAATLKEEPPWEAVPVQVRPLLRRCLEKDPRRRLRDIGDAMPMVELASEAVKAPPAGRLRPAAVILGLLVLFVSALLYFRPAPAPPLDSVRFTIAPPDTLAQNGTMALSPDGRQVAFRTGQGNQGIGVRLWVHSLDTGKTRQLPVEVTNPASVFWSPDSRFLAFQPNTSEKLYKIQISGGPPQVVAEAQGFVTGGAWSESGTIVFGSSTGPLSRVQAGGGTAVPVTAVDVSRDETNHSWPVLLPGTNNFLYLRVSREREQSGIYVGSLDAKPDQQSMKLILPTRWGASYVPPRDSGPGALLFRRDGALVSQPFDPKKLELVGDPVVVAERVGAWNTYGFFSASESGHLFYRVGDEARQRLTWMDRLGNTLSSTPIKGTVFAVSPVKDQALFTSGGNEGFSLIDFDRSTTQRFTTGPQTSPVWYRDGSGIVFAYAPKGIFNLYKKGTDGSPEQLLWESPENKFPTSVSRDGRFVLFTMAGKETGNDVWVLPIGGKPKPVRQTQSSESRGEFSPDGRYIAYESNENGAPEVYLQEFSSTDVEVKGAPVPVSSGGGTMPRWNPDGTELLYRAQTRLMSVKLGTGRTLEVGTPAPLPVLPGGTFSGVFAVSGDGKRFLFLYQDVPNADPVLSAVFNWRQF